jgi:phosphotriesterase-related protein
MRGVIRTTGGDVDPATLGPTSMHEHLLLDATVWLQSEAWDATRLADLAVSTANLPDVRWHAYSIRDNLILDDPDIAAAEVAAFGRAGGDVIVDTTTAGLGGDPAAAAAIARSAGIRLVLGAGHYVHSSHDGDVCRASVEDLAEGLDREVREGVRGSTFRPGTLGEIGMSAPPQPCERRALRAAARVAARYDMSVQIHVDGAGAFGVQHVEDCAAEGLSPDRVVCGHADEHLAIGDHRAILETGANLALDTFGSELRFSGLFHHPSDAQRMRHLVRLLEEGFADQMVLGHDVFVKAHLHAYGGNGYDHLLARVLPALQHQYGVERATLDGLMVDNPRRLLTCRPPEDGARLETGDEGHVERAVFADVGGSGAGGRRRGG